MEFFGVVLLGSRPPLQIADTRNAGSLCCRGVTCGRRPPRPAPSASSKMRATSVRIIALQRCARQACGSSREPWRKLRPGTRGRERAHRSASALASRASSAMDWTWDWILDAYCTFVENDVTDSQRCLESFQYDPGQPGYQSRTFPNFPPFPPLPLCMLTIDSLTTALR